MGNYANGNEWPDIDYIVTYDGMDPDFAETWPGHFNMHVGSREKAGEWMSGSGMVGDRQVYRRVDYMGLTKNPDKSYTARWLWVKIPSNNLPGDPKEFTGVEDDCVFYYARKYEFKGFLAFRADQLQFDQYNSRGNFKAKTTAGFDIWENPPESEEDQRVREEVDAMEDNIPRPDSDFESHLKGTTTSAAANKARAIFEQAMGETNRWQSKFFAEREAMGKIKSGVVQTMPLVALTSGGTSKHGHMAAAINKALAKAGYTTAQIQWFHNGGLTNPLTGGLGLFQIGSRVGDKNTGGKKPAPAITPPTPAVTRIVVRGPLGYTEPAGRGADMRPHIQQVSSYLDEPERYFFRNIPNTVSYQGLGSRWVEIPRKGDFPIVEWSDWALMKVSFDFLVAHNTLDGQPGQGDGLFHDVSEDLDQLRRMAQRPYPVSVFGMDQLFSLQMKRAQSTGRAMQFVIANFTVKSARRTVGEGDKEIAAAQCQMTLQEIPIENMKVVEMTMPPLTGPKIPGKEADNPSSSPELPSEHEDIQSEVIDGSLLG